MDHIICKKCKKVIPGASVYCMYCGWNLVTATKPKKTTRKRANGHGSVYKRSDMKERPWVAVAPKTKDRVGKTIRPVLGYFATEQEALAECMKFNAAPSDKINFTLKQIYDEWSVAAYKAIGPKTEGNYRDAYKKLKNLTDVKFRELKTPHLQKIIDDNSALSRSSLSKTKILLTQLFDYAMQEDVVNKNYAKFILLPKEEKTAKDCFTNEELKTIEKNVGKIDHADLILAMCYTGFRISEFFELERNSYDAKNKTLTGGKKTDAGRNRIVPIHQKISKIVAEYALRGGVTLFCRDNGDPFTADNFRQKHYYCALEQMGFEKDRQLSPHSTRHTFLTRLAAAGARAEDMKALAGHEDYSVTANIYIHQDVETLRKAINKLT